jgi:3-hydroxyacyl-CoA dehydrogenase/enoyl-CoA hydratase/3-hydroxybutyryl-CoA epimerase
VNRILLPYLVECAWMLEEGVDTRRLDAVLERFGMPMGPLTLADEVGLDIGYHAAKALEDAYGPRMQVAGVLDEVVERGLRGRKSGAGFYKYRGRRKAPNPDIRAISEAARERDGVSHEPLTDDDIVDRAVLLMVNEAARCLDERVVDDPEKLDMAMVMGTGFAPFRGGLLKYADDRGVDLIADRLSSMAVSFGDRFEPAPMLQRLADDDRAFYDGRSARGARR